MYVVHYIRRFFVLNTKVYYEKKNQKIHPVAVYPSQAYKKNSKNPKNDIVLAMPSKTKKTTTTTTRSSTTNKVSEQNQNTNDQVVSKGTLSLWSKARASTLFRRGIGLNRHFGEKSQIFVAKACEVLTRLIIEHVVNQKKEQLSKSGKASDKDTEHAHFIQVPDVSKVLAEDPIFRDFYNSIYQHIPQDFQPVTALKNKEKHQQLRKKLQEKKISQKYTRIVLSELIKKRREKAQAARQKQIEEMEKEVEEEQRREKQQQEKKGRTNAFKKGRSSSSSSSSKTSSRK